MTAKVKHLVPIGITPQSQLDWPTELKAIVDSLIDLATRVIDSNGTALTLNEVLTAEELSERLKIPASTIEELARKGKLAGAFRVGKHWRFDLDALRSNLPGHDDES
jgi:excisionase family DNA binding protein